jgi:hypothetical protein
MDLYVMPGLRSELQTAQLLETSEASLTDVEEALLLLQANEVAALAKVRLDDWTICQ